MSTIHGTQTEIDFVGDVLVGGEPEEGVVFENLPGPAVEEDPFRDSPDDLRLRAEMDLNEALTTICEPEEGIRFEDLPGLSTKTCWKEDPFRDKSKDPLVQGELIKFKFSGEDFDGFSSMKHEIACASADERRYDRRVRYASPSFPKEKLRPDPHSQMVLEQQEARQSRGRAFSILDLDGALYGPTTNRKDRERMSVIVVNGQFPDEDIRPMPVVCIETLT